MWLLPKRVFLAGTALFFGGLALGYTFDDPEGDSAVKEVLTGIAGVMYLLALLTIPLLVLLVLAALFNQPGEPRHWVWRGRFSLIAYGAWLFLCFFVWAAAHTGGGGLDGPCSSGARDLPPGQCRTEGTSWPPLSTRVIVDGPEGHFERVYPSTVGLILIAATALAPLALWPVARWLTSDQRTERPPFQPLAALLGAAVVLSLGYSALVDEEISRSLTPGEEAGLEADRQAAVAPAPAPGPVVYTPTRVSVRDVSAVVNGLASTGDGSTECAAPNPSGIGLWTCVTTLTDATELSSRLTIESDGTYSGINVDRHGVERPFQRCCIPVSPE